MKTLLGLLKRAWPEYKIPIVLASLGALFHLIFVVYPLIASLIFGVRGDGLGLWVVIVDSPLVWIEDAVGFRLSTSMEVLYLSFFGTLMYAGFGWVVGWLIGGFWNRLFFRKDPKKPNV